MKALGLLAAGVALDFWNAFVITLLWRWFAVPLGVPAIGMAMAIGLAMLASRFNGGSDRMRYGGPLTSEDIERLMLHGAIRPTMVLGVGYLAHLAALR